MLTIITATAGSGKTLYIVKLIDELLKTQTIIDGIPSAPRLVYTNIEGLKKEMFAVPEAITLFDVPDEWGVNPFDWRDTPDGSLIIYDEAQYFFPTRVNPETEKIISEISTHRHQGKDIICITQNPTLIHSKLKANCGEHLHFYRAFGMEVSTKYIWQHFCESPNSRYEQLRAQQEIFKFPKRYYDYYKSSVQHTVKKYIPKKLKYLIAAACLFFGISAYNFFNYGIGFLGIKKENSLVPESVPVASELASPNVNNQVAPTDEKIDLSKPYGWAALPPVPAVRGCVANKRKNWCQCFGENNTPIQMEHAQCLSVLSKPLPFATSLNQTK